MGDAFERVTTYKWRWLCVRNWLRGDQYLARKQCTFIIWIKQVATTCICMILEKQYREMIWILQWGDFVIHWRKSPAVSLAKHTCFLFSDFFHSCPDFLSFFKIFSFGQLKRKRWNQQLSWLLCPSNLGRQAPEVIFLSKEFELHDSYKCTLGKKHEIKNCKYMVLKRVVHCTTEYTNRINLLKYAQQKPHAICNAYLSFQNLSINNEITIIFWRWSPFTESASLPEPQILVPHCTLLGIFRTRCYCCWAFENIEFSARKRDQMGS